MMVLRLLSAYSYALLLYFMLARDIVSASPVHFQRNHEQTNLIFIMFDDMRLELFNYGRKHMITPNFDRLAKKSVTFDNAHCQIAVCNPSRDSLLTGLRPDALADYNFQNTFGRHMILPQQLVASGYSTAAYGKVLHADIGGGPDVWSEGSWRKDWYEYQNHEGSLMNASVQPDRTRREDEFRDHIIMSRALTGLQDLERKRLTSNTNFMLAIGFKLPHIALHVPYKYYAMYKDRDEVWNSTTAKDLQYPSETTVAGYRCCGERLFRFINDEGQRPADPKVQVDINDINAKFPAQANKELLIGYAAAVTFLDVQLGRLLDSLDEMKLWDKVTIVLTSDHGMHLGEKGIWEKWTLFDEGTRVPLMIYHPLSPFKGQHYRYPVELVDVYPTVTDLIQAPFKTRAKVCKETYTCKHFQGKSLAMVVLGPQVWSVDKQKGNAKLDAPGVANKGLRGAVDRSGRRGRAPADQAPQLNPDLVMPGFVQTGVRRRLETLMEFLTRTGKAIAANATLPPIPMFGSPAVEPVAPPAPAYDGPVVTDVNSILMHQDFALTQHMVCAFAKDVLEKTDPIGFLRPSFKQTHVPPIWLDCDVRSSSTNPALPSYSLMGYSMRTMDYRYTAWVRFNISSLAPIWPSKNHGKPFARAMHAENQLPESGVVYEELYSHKNSAGPGGVNDPLADYLHAELDNLAYVDREPFVTDLESHRRRMVVFLQHSMTYLGRT